MSGDDGRATAKNNNSNNNNTGQDCILCRITGSVGMFGISVYVFMEAFKHTKKTNRLFLNTLGTGRSS